MKKTVALIIMDGFGYSDNSLGNAIIKAETGKVFAKCLEHAGVYKRNEEGRKAFIRFMASVK